MKIKLCGFTEKESLQTAIDCKVDFIGFVFHEKSPRNIDFASAALLAKIIPNNISKVAIVVDADFSMLQNIADSLRPQYFQLHGSEDRQKIIAIKSAFPEIKIIKALSVEKKSDLAQTADFIDLVDFFLFDNPKDGPKKTFNFELLQGFSCQKEWFLAGGLNINNINEALKIKGVNMIDISSGIEKEKGVKCSALISQLCANIKI